MYCTSVRLWFVQTVYLCRHTSVCTCVSEMCVWHAEEYTNNFDTPELSELMCSQQEEFSEQHSVFWRWFNAKYWDFIQILERSGDVSVSNIKLGGRHLHILLGRQYPPNTSTVITNLGSGYSGYCFHYVITATLMTYNTWMESTWNISIKGTFRIQSKTQFISGFIVGSKSPYYSVFISWNIEQNSL